MDLVARTIFVPVQHHTMNYPMAYYAAFVPNMPMKIYDDPRVPPEEFGLYSLPQYPAATVKLPLKILQKHLNLNRKVSFVMDEGTRLCKSSAFLMFR